MKIAALSMSLSLLAVAAGCTEEADVETVATGDALVEHGWRAAPARTPLAQGRADDGAIGDRELTDDVLAARAAQDSSWRAADGARFDALFVAGDGTAYGRTGDARAMTAPTGADTGAYNPAQTKLWEGALYIILGGTLDSDRRIRYSTTADLESYPIRTVGSLSGSGNTMSGGCTGTMVGPRHVITAAHCVMSSSGAITTSGFFNPGQTNTTILNGGTSRHWSGVMLRDWRVARRFDYALLYLDDSPANVALGWMGVAWWDNTLSYVGKSAFNKGYPCGPNMNCGLITNQKCKASPRSDDRCDGWMYGDSSTLTVGSATADSLLQYDIDTSDGHSGSSVYTYLNGSPAVMAIHFGPSGNLNGGSRFRTSMWNDICTWIADVPSAYGTHGLCH